MTSSPDVEAPAHSHDDLPPSLSSMWRLVKLGYRAEPGLLVFAFVMVLFAALPDALLALWLKLIAQGVLDDDRRLVYIAAAGLGISATATWFLKIVGDRAQRRFRDRVTIFLESHVAHLQASVPTIEHQERPEHLDRLAVLRDQVFTLDHMYMSVFSTAGWIMRLAVTMILLSSVSPLLLLLVLFAIPTVVTASWRPGVERDVEERVASRDRLARHLFVLGTTPPPAKEVRLDGIGERLVDDRRTAWEGWYAPIAAARWSSAVWHALAWAVFGSAYVGAVVFVASGLNASVGDVLLVLAAGSRLSQYVGATVGEIGFLRGIWLDGARRLAWLEDYSSAIDERADQTVPARLRDGIRLEHVSFRYPGTDRLVLDDVDLELPAGSVVAIVGENGAGKSTLVKLLCRFYDPASGHVTVDGTDLARVPTAEWRERLAGAFQDFFRFELRASETVGVGDLDRIDERLAVDAAVDRAGARDVVDHLTGGLDTQLGVSWDEGVEISFGQWQKLALARGFMRDHPLLVVLDEPTAALDAETEHALFERYAASARDAAGIADGRITVLVSHRFSTVRMADLIVVLDGARVVEVGTHDDLVARKGQYADLYNIQAAAYR